MIEKIYFISTEISSLLFFAAIETLSIKIPCFIGTEVQADSIIVSIDARQEDLATVEKYLAPFV